jgi:hypothetical protein
MNGSLRKSQRGISFFGLLFVGVLLACAGVVVAQVAPTFIEYLAVQKAAKKAATEGSTVAEVQAIFDRAAAVEDIKSITGRDLDISKQGDKVVVEFSYNRELPLVGPAYLLLKYSGSSN